MKKLKNEKSTTEIYFVRVRRPFGVSKTEMKQYIKAAITNWCGSYCPDDPIFDAGAGRITVISYKTFLYSIIRKVCTRPSNISKKLSGKNNANRV